MIALKSVRQRMLPSCLTSLSVALGVALMIAVILTNGVISRLFVQDSIGYDLIVGPKGSKTDLIFSVAYRISQPIENLPWRYYTELKQDPRIELAVPVAIGDVTEEGGFPMVGTISEYFTLDVAAGRPQRVRGRLFRSSWDAVIGSRVAEDNNWDIGSQFKLIHSGQSDHVHDERFTVVGVLAPTGTADDRSAFIHLNGFFALSEHGKPAPEAVAREMKFFGESEAEVRARYGDQIAAIEEHDRIVAAGGHHHIAGGLPDLQKEVSAIYVKVKEVPGRSTIAASRVFSLQTELQEGFQAQAVNPMQVMPQLMSSLVGNVQLVLLFLTGLIVLVSGISIFVSIYNSMSERRREIAIMRALGAGRTTVFLVILLESMLLCVGGGVLGVLLGHGILAAAAPIVESRTGIVINALTYELLELYVLPAMIVLATLVGFLPGLTAYRTDVAANLSA